VEFDASQKIPAWLRLTLALAAAGLLSACAAGADLNNAPAWLQDDNAVTASSLDDA